MHLGVTNCYWEWGLSSLQSMLNMWRSLATNFFLIFMPTEDLGDTFLADFMPTEDLGNPFLLILCLLKIFATNSCWLNALCLPIGKLLFVLVSFQFPKIIVFFYIQKSIVLVLLQVTKCIVPKNFVLVFLQFSKFIVLVTFQKVLVLVCPRQIQYKPLLWLGGWPWLFQRCWT